MRVFITGASGHIGSAVVPELLGAGHQVIGLARSDASAAALTQAGVEVHRGDLDDLDVLRAAAASSDGVIHLAFKHEEMQAGNYEAAVAADLRAIDALGDAVAGTDKPLVGTGGTLMLAFADLGRTGTEADVLAVGPRVDAENAVVALAGRGVRSSVVRLPPTVHSSLDHHGFVPSLIALAGQKGFAGYVGDGANRWPGGTRSTPPACTGWRWKVRPEVRSCTRWTTRACPSGRSPRPSAGGCRCPSRASIPTTPRPTSAT